MQKYKFDQKLLGSTCQLLQRYKGYDPRELFDRDFIRELDTFYQLGDNLVIGIDLNNDAKDSQIAC